MEISGDGFHCFKKGHKGRMDNQKPELSSNNSSPGKIFCLRFSCSVGPISQATLWLTGKKLAKNVKSIAKIAAVLLLVSSSVILQRYAALKHISRLHTIDDGTLKNVVLSSL